MAQGELGSFSVAGGQIPLGTKSEEVFEVEKQEHEVKSGVKGGENDYDGDDDDDDDDDEFDDNDDYGEGEEEEDSCVLHDCKEENGGDLKVREEEDEESSDVAAEELRKKIGDHHRDFLPSGTGKVDHKTWIRYWRQVSRSKGFDIQDFPGVCELTGVAPLWKFRRDPVLDKIVHEFANKAIESYNNRWGKDYKFQKILTVNAQVLCGVMYYITFEASKEDAVVTFQTKCFEGFEKSRVKFCRRKRISNRAAQ